MLIQNRCDTWRWQPTLVSLPGESHGQRSLVGCSPWGRKEWDTTEQGATFISLHSQGMLVPTGTVLQSTELGPSSQPNMN